MLMPYEATAHSGGQLAGTFSGWVLTPSIPGKGFTPGSGVGVGGRLATTVADSSAVSVASGICVSGGAVGSGIAYGAAVGALVGSALGVARGVWVGAAVGGAAVGDSVVVSAPQAARLKSTMVVRSRRRRCISSPI